MCDTQGVLLEQTHHDGRGFLFDGEHLAQAVLGFGQFGLLVLTSSSQCRQLRLNLIGCSVGFDRFLQSLNLRGRFAESGRATTAAFATTTSAARTGTISTTAATTTTATSTSAAAE
jgi:hypothetical protein